MSKLWQSDTSNQAGYIFNIPHGKRPCQQVFILVFLYFVCVCNVSFEIIFLSPMMLNFWLGALVSAIKLYKSSVILQLITVAVSKVCLEIFFSKNLYYIKTGQLICKAIN